MFIVYLRLHAGESRRDCTKEGEGEGGGGRKRGIIVTFEVREKGRFKSSIGANVGTQSGDMVHPIGSGQTGLHLETLHGGAKVESQRFWEVT